MRHLHRYEPAHVGSPRLVGKVVLPQSLQDVDQPCVGIYAVQAEYREQALENPDSFRSHLDPGEETVAASQHDRPHATPRWLCRRSHYADIVAQAVDGSGRTGRIVCIKTIRVNGNDGIRKTDLEATPVVAWYAGYRLQYRWLSIVAILCPFCTTIKSPLVNEQGNASEKVRRP